MSNIKISIIIPIYNVGGELRRCIDSILNQTYKKLEVILVDDGSTDDSAEICDEYAGKYKFIRVLHQENRGVSVARNLGVKQATGDYVSFVDADDYLHPEYFEILLKGLENSEAEVSCCKWTWDVCENPKVFPKVFPSFEVLSAEEAFVSSKVEKGPYCKIVKRDAIGKIEFNKNLVFLEDSIYTKDLLLNGLIKNVVVTSLPLYYYYQRPSSASHTKPASERIPALECSFSRIGTYQDENRNYLWMESTVKLLCSTREAAQKEKDKKTVLKCNTIARKLTPQIKKDKTQLMAKKVVLVVLANSALAYDIIRNGKIMFVKLKRKLKR